MGFRLRQDGLLDRRFISRGGRARGGGAGCVGALLWLGLLSIAACALAPFVLVPWWIATEVSQFRGRRPRQGFTPTDEENVRLDSASRRESEAASEIEALEQEGSSADLRRNQDGTFDRRNPLAGRLEDRRASALAQTNAAREERLHVRSAVLSRYFAWADRQPRLWSLRLAVAVLAALTLISRDGLTAWTFEVTRIGTAAFSAADLFFASFWLGWVAIGGALIGWAGGRTIARASLPEFLPPKDIERSSWVGTVVVGGGAAALGILMLHYVVGAVYEGRAFRAARAFHLEAEGSSPVGSNVAPPAADGGAWRPPRGSTSRPTTASSSSRSP